MSQDAPTRTLDVGADLGGSKNFRLEFQGIRHSGPSFTVRVFLNQPGATAATPLESNPHYLGNIYLYGHGDAVDDASLELQPFDSVVYLTSRNRPALEDGTNSITLVVVDQNGKPLDAGIFRFDGLRSRPR